MLYQHIVKAACVLAFAVMSLMSAGLARADVIYLAIDLSSSTTFSTNAEFARGAGLWVARELEGLPEGSRVHIHTLGDYGQLENLTRVTLEVTPRRKAHKVARHAGGVVARVPELIKQGTVEGAKTTHLISYLENESYTMNCKAEPTRIILLSDGVEWSSEVDGRALMAGQVGLPEPTSKILEGCEGLTMLSIGQMQGGNPALTRHLIVAWRNWAEAAGIKTFRPVPTF